MVCIQRFASLIDEIMVSELWTYFIAPLYSTSSITLVCAKSQPSFKRYQHV